MEADVLISPPGSLAVRRKPMGSDPPRTLAATLAAQPEWTSQPGNADVWKDPLITWATLQVSCRQIQVQGDSSTRVAAEGERRRNVATDGVTPEQAHLGLASVLDKEATWSGRLVRLAARHGETHLVVALSSSPVKLGFFEAFAAGEDFVDELADYAAGDDHGGGGDEVAVVGTVCKPDAAGYRWQAGVPLLQVKEVRRKDTPGARRRRPQARPGHVR